MPLRILPLVLALVGACDSLRAAPMVTIAGGQFGVHVVERFELDVYEVTVAPYRACVDAGGCSAPRTTGLWAQGDGFEEVASESCSGARSDRDDHPIDCVDYYDAEKYCAWAGKRLPTEWEWEWAARGGAHGWTYPWGNDAPTGEHAIANLDTPFFRMSDEERRPLDDGFKGSAPVGSKPKGKSADGVYDLAGNVREWTSSKLGEPEDGSKWSQPGRSEQQVARGGGWYAMVPGDLEVAHRQPFAPVVREDRLGFRCARS